MHTDLGKLALRLVEHDACKAIVSITVAHTVSQVAWRKEPLTELRNELLEASETGFKVCTLMAWSYVMNSWL